MKKEGETLGRYKFALNPKVKGYIEWQLEHYWEDKKQLEEYKRDMIPSATQSLSLSGGVQRGGTSNPTEQSALRLVTSPYIASMEQSIRAIEAVLARCDDTDIKLIDLVYWRRTYTVMGAAYKAHISKSGAYNRINNIMSAIAVECGIVNI